MNKYYLVFFIFASALLMQCNNRVQPSDPSVSVDPASVHDPLDTFTYNVQPYLGAKLDLSTEEIQHYISNFLDTLQVGHYVKDKMHQQQIKAEIDSFYHLNDNRLFWATTHNVRPQTKVLISELLNASANGLNSEDYDISKLINFQQEVFGQQHLNVLQLIQLDIRYTSAYVSYGYHLANGRTEPIEIDKKWNNSSLPESVAKRLCSLKIKDAIDSVTPQNENYSGLKKALERYKAIALNEGWPVLPEDANIRLGDSSNVVPLLRERLYISQDLESNAVGADSLIFTSDLENAVKRFQDRHGLEIDGIVGKGTIRQMNISVNDRIEEIKLNLERIRWMPDQLGSHYIYVNIPEYMLYVYKDEKIPLQMRVITGETDHATPVMNDRLNYLVFSPTWTIPKKIIQNEMLPKIKNDPDYLTRNGYQLYEGWNANDEPIDPMAYNWDSVENINQVRIVQKPGSGNALGKVKFPLTNERNIYLHDTPSHYLFSRSARAFSHGCVRLNEPAKLAEYLLQDQKWDSKKIKEHMNKEQPVNVTLTESLPVYFVYRTAFIDQRGLINFRKDVYDIDKAQMLKLKGWQEKQLATLF